MSKMSIPQPTSPITSKLLKDISAYKKSCDTYFPYAIPDNKGSYKNKRIKILQNIILQTPNILNDFINILQQLLGQKLPKHNEDNVIQGILYKTLFEINKKYEDKNFYVQNGVAFIEATNFIITHLKKHDLKQFDGIVLDHFIRQLHEFMIDSYFMFNDIFIYLLKEKRNLGYKVPTQHVFSMWQGFRQILFQKGSGLCFMDKEYDGGAIGLIRISIENRIRNGFGIFGIIDTKNNSFVPLDLTKIFEFIKPYNDKDIIFIKNLANIERINSWTNIYMHSGRRAYSWIPHRIYLYLHPLFVGEKGSIATGFNMNSGIKVRHDVIIKIWNDIETKINAPRKMIDKIKAKFKKKINRYILYRYNDEKDIEAALF